MRLQRLGSTGVSTAPAPSRLSGRADYLQQPPKEGDVVGPFLQAITLKQGQSAVYADGEPFVPGILLGWIWRECQLRRSCWGHLLPTYHRLLDGEAAEEMSGQRIPESALVSRHQGTYRRIGWGVRASCYLGSGGSDVGVLSRGFLIGAVAALQQGCSFLLL